MAADPRGHRRHREHRAAGLARIRQLHRSGVEILCRLCGKPLDPFQPYDGGRNPLAPTLEHVEALSEGGAVFQPTGPDRWAHKLCQDRQGAGMTNRRKAAKASRTSRPRINSRRW